MDEEKQAAFFFSSGSSALACGHSQTQSHRETQSHDSDRAEMFNHVREGTAGKARARKESQRDGEIEDHRKRKHKPGIPEPSIRRNKEL